jgi:hypothetical protein
MAVESALRSQPHYPSWAWGRAGNTPTSERDRQCITGAAPLGTRILLSNFQNFQKITKKKRAQKEKEKEKEKKKRTHSTGERFFTSHRKLHAHDNLLSGTHMYEPPTEFNLCKCGFLCRGASGNHGVQLES